MYRVSSKSLKEQKHPRLERVRILLFFNRKKSWNHDFQDSFRLTAASTKPDFCFFLTLIVKNTVHLGDGDIWLQLVESFSNLGLRLSEELFTVEPARATS